MAKILIIEDEAILAEMYKDKFSSANHKVILAYDAQEGFLMTKKHKPDLILLDILLPKEDGLSFLRKMRDDPEIKQIKVIAFSNYDVPETKTDAYKLGVEDYLIKTNYTPQEMIEKIERYLSK